MEAAIKMALQYFRELPTPQPQRTKLIARKLSYHGNTLGSLALGHHPGRRAPYESILSSNITHVSQYHPYRDMLPSESPKAYVARLAQELEDEFQRQGQDTICAVALETMAGSVSVFVSLRRESYWLSSRTDFGMCPTSPRIFKGHERSM